MIKQLYESTRPTRGFMARETMTKYNEVLKGPRDLKSLSQWLDRWEDTITKAFQYRLPVTYSGQWLRDIRMAIKPITETYTQAFLSGAIRLDEISNQIVNQEARYHLPTGSITAIRPTDAMATGNAISLVSDSTIYTHRKVAQELREWLQTPRYKIKPRAVRGGALQADEALNDKEIETEAPQGQKRQRSHTSGGSEPNKASSRCAACGKPGHSLLSCWHIFEDQRPQDVSRNDYLARKAARVIEANSELRKEVDEITISKRSTSL